mmetsp:Transcript_16042/g.39934  ORF Transcript_16042/g.39934 Transcript_16042/m.39934 type:complete len:387 (-) Transcript_16042:126-1286(-)
MRQLARRQASRPLERTFGSGWSAAAAAALLLAAEGGGGVGLGHQGLAQHVQLSLGVAASGAVGLVRVPVRRVLLGVLLVHGQLAARLRLDGGLDRGRVGQLVRAVRARLALRVVQQRVDLLGVEVELLEGAQRSHHGGAARLGAQLAQAHLADAACQGHKHVGALVAELGVRGQSLGHLAGGRLHGRQVVVAVRQRVANVVKQRRGVVAKVGERAQQGQQLLGLVLGEVGAHVGGDRVKQGAVVVASLVEAHHQVRHLLRLHGAQLGGGGLRQALVTALAGVARGGQPVGPVRHIQLSQLDKLLLHQHLLSKAGHSALDCARLSSAHDELACQAESGGHHLARQCHERGHDLAEGGLRSRPAGSTSHVPHHLGQSRAGLRGGIGCA